jgi:Domain of unknown function (DUF929)
VAERSELSRLAAAIVDRPLVTRPALGELRASNRRRLVRRLTGLSAAVAVVVVGVVGLTQAPSSPRGPRPQLAVYFEAGVNVPDTALAAVGLPASVSAPTRVTPTAATADSDGSVIYIGAEYCPYCAVQRWALLVALSRFGTFTNLSNSVLSSSTYVYPDLASWTFVGAKYSSRYFSFMPTEIYSSRRTADGYVPLQAMTPAQKTAFNSYDTTQGLAFVDIGNRYVAVGSSSSPAPLEGLTLSQIGSALAHASSPIAQAVDGTANYFIAAMCQIVTGAKPAICSSNVTTQALTALQSATTTAPTTTTAPASTTTSGSSPVPVKSPTNAPLFGAP